MKRNITKGKEGKGVSWKQWFPSMVAVILIRLSETTRMSHPDIENNRISARVFTRRRLQETLLPLLLGLKCSAQSQSDCFEFGFVLSDEIGMEGEINTNSARTAI